MLDPGIEDLVAGDLSLAELIPDPRVREDIRGPLDAEDRTAFWLELVLPATRPRFADVSEYLEAAERTARLAVIFAFGDWKRLREFPDVGALLEAHRNVPITVVALGLSSIKVTLEGDSREIAHVLGKNGPPDDWRRRLLRTVAAMFAGSMLTLKLIGGDPTPAFPVQFPDQPHVQRVIKDTCGYLPNGSEITVKFPMLEAKVVCKNIPPPPGHRQHH